MDRHRAPPWQVVVGLGSLFLALTLFLFARSPRAPAAPPATPTARHDPSSPTPRTSPTKTLPPPPTSTATLTVTATATPSPTATATPAFPQRITIGYGAKVYTCRLEPADPEARVLRLGGDCLGSQGELLLPHVTYAGSPLNYRVEPPPGYEVVRGPGIWVDGQGRIFALCGAPRHTQPGRQVCVLALRGAGGIYRVEIPVEIVVGPTATPVPSGPSQPPTLGPPPDPDGTDTPEG